VERQSLLRDPNLMDSDDFQQAQYLLARRIKRLRKEASMSQEALAHNAEIDRTYVSQLERSLVNPSLAVLIRISRSLKIHVSELLR